MVLLRVLLWGIFGALCAYVLVEMYRSRSRKARLKCSICGGRVEDGGYWIGNSICLACYKALSAYRYARGLMAQSPMHERAFNTKGD